MGKLRPACRTLCDEYLGRIRRYGPLVEREVRAAGKARTAELARREEGARLAAAIPARTRVVALERDGTPWSSEDLARQLARWLEGASDLCLLIGGAAGLDPGVVRQAGARWSLGPLTLPHELARVVVVEQWYRAWTILRGEPYHRGGQGCHRETGRAGRTP
ncbi:MAG: 23S rRNA (pseudouridine(1915)-N(3))-methyltransferase RlmH [Gemmatimonadales bacterium]